MSIRAPLLAILLTFATSNAVALPIISSTSFDLLTVSALNASGATATGTSNGVGWTMDSHFSSCCGHNNAGSYNGFNTGDFVVPISNTDAIHVTQNDISLTFDQTIDEIVFYVRENGGRANFDFGLAPTFLSGAGNFTHQGGTRYGVNTSGGAFSFSGLNSTFLHSANIFDGMDMAFFVSASVPAPSSVLLLFTGLALMLRRRRA